MIQSIIVWFIKFSPSSKRWFWKFWYNLFARKSQFHEFRFMNYGYDEDGFSPEISKEYENERFPVQLYHHTATQIDISNMDLVDTEENQFDHNYKVNRLFHIHFLKSEIQIVLQVHNFYKNSMERIS